jgi:hypothetical protein
MALSLPMVRLAQVSEGLAMLKCFESSAARYVVLLIAAVVLCLHGLCDFIGTLISGQLDRVIPAKALEQLHKHVSDRTSSSSTNVLSVICCPCATHVSMCNRQDVHHARRQQ